MGRSVIITISEEFLFEMLSIPNEGVELRGTDWDFDTSTFRLYLKGDGLPKAFETAEGEVSKRASPLCRRREDGTVEFQWWDGLIPNVEAPDARPDQ